MNKKPENWIHGMAIEKKCNFLEEEVRKLKEKINELETQLYYCNRNKEIEKVVNGR